MHGDLAVTHSSFDCGESYVTALRPINKVARSSSYNNTNDM